MKIKLITRKILERDMESCYKNVYKIPDVLFTFQNFERKFQKRKKSKIDEFRKINEYV